MSVILSDSCKRLFISLIRPPIYLLPNQIFIFLTSPATCLVCTGSGSSATAPHPQNIHACAKFTSTPFPVRRTSQPVSRSLSAAVLKPPEMLTDESLGSWAAPCPLTSLIPSCGFQAGAVLMDTDTAAKLTVGLDCHGSGGWLWGWNWGWVREPQHW